MKVRNGFVSNSSSSSFIIAMDKTTEEVQVSIKRNLLDLEEKQISTEDDIKEYIDDYYGYSSYEECSDDTNCDAKNIWDKMRKCLSSGKKIVVIRGSNDDDDSLSLEIYQNGADNINLPKGVKLLGVI